MSDHEWCRDVRRDEQVRAAEDAAAVPSIQHRDLPEAVAALTERVARLEAAEAAIGTGDVFADELCGSTADEIARLTAERDAAILERRAANEEVEDWSRRCGRILDERDAARARVAELESQLESVACRAATAETALREIFAQDYARASVNGAAWKMHDLAEKALIRAAGGEVDG